MRGREDNVLVFTISKKSSIRFNPNICLLHPAGGAKPGFASMEDLLFISAIGTLIEMKTNLLGSTFEHFIDIDRDTGTLDLLLMKGFKRSVVIRKDLLKIFFASNDLHTVEAGELVYHKLIVKEEKSLLVCILYGIMTSLMNRETLRPDVTIVGGGITGLMATKELLGKGYDVMLVDESGLLSGATGRNQGWLHSGSLQSNSRHLDPTVRAERTAHVQEGFRRLGPYIDAVREGPRNSKMITMYSREADGDAAEEDWRAVGLNYPRMPLSTFYREVPEVNRDLVGAAFEVNDVSVNTRRLTEILAGEIIDVGGRIHTHTAFTPVDSTTADMETPDKSYRVKSGLVVVAAGAGIKDFFERYTGEEFPMRYWQGSTLITPALTQHGIIWREPKGVNAIRHGATSLTNLGFSDTEMGEPNYDDVPLEKQAELVRVTESLIPGSSEQPRTIVACVKPYITTGGTTDSVDLQLGEYVDGYVYCLPGKMTAGPAAADKIVDFVENGKQLTPSPVSGRDRAVQLTRPDITPRPCDVFVGEAK